MRTLRYLEIKSVSGGDAGDGGENASGTIGDGGMCTGDIGFTGGVNVCGVDSVSVDGVGQVTTVGVGYASPVVDGAFGSALGSTAAIFVATAISASPAGVAVLGLGALAIGAAATYGLQLNRYSSAEQAARRGTPLP